MIGQKEIKTVKGSAGGKAVFVICGWLGDDGLSSGDGPGKKICTRTSWVWRMCGAEIVSARKSLVKKNRSKKEALWCGCV